MRELPPPDQLLKEHDRDSIIMLPPDGWFCPHCPPRDVIGTVDWIEGPDGREFGRCRRCGQKLVLADAA
ncbi:MAG: hypothetical protein AB7F65_10065 [Dehalococcoidia bacterium]